MGYREAIEANGVTVKEYKEFGSYQGTFIVVLTDGRFIEGYYGSCSGCDAYQGEFGWDEEPKFEDGKYWKGPSWREENECTKEEYERALAEYKERHRRFGQSYLDGAETLEQITERYKRRCEDEYAWEDDKEILEWLQNYPHEPK